MTTTIHSNGSKWLGQDPDSIDTLLDLLAREPLDPTFEQYGNFMHPGPDGMTTFFGNFNQWSHVFRIDTDDPAVITALRRAIRTNQRRPSYRAAKRECTAREERRKAEVARECAERQRKAEIRRRVEAAYVAEGF